jgi:hypothetical protein
MLAMRASKVDRRMGRPKRRAIAACQCEAWVARVLSEILRVRRDVFGPKFVHDALNFFGVVVMTIWGAVPELAQAHGAGLRIPRIRRESCISWLVGDAFGCDLELIPPD